MAEADAVGTAVGSSTGKAAAGLTQGVGVDPHVTPLDAAFVVMPPNARISHKAVERAAELCHVSDRGYTDVFKKIRWLAVGLLGRESRSGCGSPCNPECDASTQAGAPANSAPKCRPSQKESIEASVDPVSGNILSQLLLWAE